MLIIVMGLPGSGKSYFAKNLCHRLHIQYIGSDQVRKEMEAMGKYNLEDKKRIYESMRSRAEASLKERNPVLLDATFFKNDLRIPFISLAENLKIPFFQILIEAPEEIIKERVSGQREDSEADFEVYKKLAKEFEPPTMPYLKLTSTQNNIESMLEAAGNYISIT